MLGTGLRLGRGRGEDRFHNPVHPNLSMQSVDNDILRRTHSGTTRDKPVRMEPENRTGPFDQEKPLAVPSCEPVSNRLSNLERFLQAITPSVPAQYLSKRTVRGFRTGDADFLPYFVLGDLWEHFQEWSAYGAGVPLVLNDNDSVVQYYVPYLSAIQIYSATAKPYIQSRQLVEDSDSDFRDSSSDGSSDCEPERGFKCSRECRNLPQLSDEVPQCVSRLSLGDHPTLPQDADAFVKSHGYMIFEYLEQDPPYSREPLADKILDLAFQFPQLATLGSCDILPSSWFSVAWYPIYRIPTGPTLKDLDACFLTFHSLYTPVEGLHGVQNPVVSYSTEMDGAPNLSLPVFGLAAYKFKGSLWSPNGGHERQLASSLVQAADSWLRHLRVKHPDFVFFNRR